MILVFIMPSLKDLSAAVFKTLFKVTPRLNEGGRQTGSSQGRPGSRVNGRRERRQHKLRVG